MKKTLLKLLFAIALILPVAASAKVPANAEAVKTHLEFLGYKVTQNEKRMKATHSKYVNFLLKKYRGGIYCIAYFGASPEAKSDRLGYLNALNKLNSNAIIVRFYADKVSDLAVEAVYVGAYEKARFGDFIDKFNNAQKQLKKDQGGIKKYIK